MNIYRSFEQWKNGGFLEHGAPRTEEYTAEELHLVEMGWNYGYDAGRAVEQALDKKAKNARELGLSYDTPLSSFVRSNDEAKAEVMERVIDKATEEQKAVIGCVNHDCDQCKAVQEPVGEMRFSAIIEGMIVPVVEQELPVGTKLYTTPPTPQPVPVKTYHDGKPWPVAPAPDPAPIIQQLVTALEGSGTRMRSDQWYIEIEAVAAGKFYLNSKGKSL
jgi:hypothetical protein